jgi:chemotaxis methyl-accepting protein methylase
MSVRNNNLLPQQHPAKSAGAMGLYRSIKDKLRYRWRLVFQPRKNHIYSKFYRFPSQLAAMRDSVLPQVLGTRAVNEDSPLRVVVFASCSGEEVYSLAHFFATHLPGLPVVLHGYELVPELVAQAKSATFTREHVLSCPFVNEELVQSMFDKSGDHLQVKPKLTSVVQFETGDITDAAFMGSLPQADLVFAQNVLFHLPRPVARRAFGLLKDRVRRHGALFINGMDTDMRESLTRQAGLEPVSDRLEEIHEEARLDRGADWSSNYWGREPLVRTGDWVRRYATVFFVR